MSFNTWITLAIAVVAAPVFAQSAPSAGVQPNWWSQPGGENGPERLVWAAQKTPETPYTGVNKPIWHVADILKSHQGQARWEEKVVLTRDFDGRYVQMAPGDKAKCLFYADDRVFGWVYSGALKMTIDGQEPKVLSKGWAFNVAPRLSYCIETVGSEPVVYYRTTPAGQAPSYPENEAPTPVPGYTYVKTKITSTGGYDSFNKPFFNVTEYGDSNRTGERFLYDGHTSSNLNIGTSLTELPPATNWGHWHANMVELWVNVYGNVCALMSGIGVVRGELGDVINANEERWHRATSCPNTGKSIRMAMTPRSKEGQVHYYQVDQRPGGGDAAAVSVPTPGIPSTGFAGLDNYRASRIAMFTDDFGQLARYRAENKALAAGAAAKDRVVFFGDSITDIWKLQTYFAGKPYVNRGIGGQTTPQMLVRFRQDVIDLGPKAVVILAGTNDIAGNTGPMRNEDIEANVVTMTELAKSHGIAAVVASILPVHDFTPRSQDFFAQRPTQRILDVNRWLEDYCARNRIVYLDYFSAMVDSEGLLRKELADDGLHPNDAGYRIMAPLAEAAIAKATSGR